MSSGWIANWAKWAFLYLMLPCLGVYADPWEPYSGTIHWEYSGPWHWEESNLKTVQTATGYKQTCEVKITGYSGSATDITIPPKITMSQTVTDNGSVIISWEYEATVTSIGESAFACCSGLTSVTIPNSVTSIGRWAFDSCSGIKSVVVPQYVLDGGLSIFSSYQSITNVAYSGIITNISASAFYGCSGLTRVTIPNSVTSIGSSAFYNCSGLTGVTIGNGVTSIPDYAFCDCSSLTSVTIPNGVKSLGREAFSGCSSLASISIPESVTYFGASCFEGCPVYTLPLYRMVLGVGGSSGGGSAEPVDPRYALAASPADRAIASVTVDADCTIDSFVLKNGKVYDSVLRIVNTSAGEVRLTLPAGYVYETFKGAKPLTIPANSRNILTITRTTGDTFLVSREELQTVQ